MKPHLNFSTLLRGTLGALLIQGLAFTPAAAREPDGRVPYSVATLHSTSHRLTETVESEFRSSRPSPGREAQRRFLEAARNLESSSRILRERVASREPVRRLQSSIADVRTSMNALANTGRDLRLSNRTRDLLYQTRSLVNQVEEQRHSIYAMSSGNDRHDRRDDRQPSLGRAIDRILSR